MESVHKCIIVTCVMALNLLSNSTFIYIVYLISELRTITNAYLVNMPVADVMYVNLSGTPFHSLTCCLQ